MMTLPLRQLSFAVRPSPLGMVWRSLSASAGAQPLVVTSTLNAVTTITLNAPKQLNGWTQPMTRQLHAALLAAGEDPECSAAVLTGSGTYYSAGVNLSGAIQPMLPKKLHAAIVASNKLLFQMFLDFPKPIFVALNGHAIGAPVTSATLCDAIVAVDHATIQTPFARLGVAAEGCSSVHFERIMGAEAATKMLEQNYKMDMQEAQQLGFVAQTVPAEQLMETAQQFAEGWLAEGKGKQLAQGKGSLAELSEVNARESVALADAFLSYKFLDQQYQFLSSKGKTQAARTFWVLKTLRPMWAMLL